MKKKTGFEKFHKVKSGSALKEQIRQEKGSMIGNRGFRTASWGSGVQAQ
jgi:hypothetical protein